MYNTWIFILKKVFFYRYLKKKKQITVYVIDKIYEITRMQQNIKDCQYQIKRKNFFFLINFL
jgi:hypothetical protein